MLGNLVVNKQGLHRNACGRVLHLRIKGDSQGLAQIRRAVEVDMTDSLAMAKYRDATVLGDVADKPLRPPRNDQIDLLIELQHLCDIIASAQQVNRRGRNVQKVADRVTPNSYQRMIGMRS